MDNDNELIKDNYYIYNPRVKINKKNKQDRYKPNTQYQQT